LGGGKSLQIWQHRLEKQAFLRNPSGHLQLLFTVVGSLLLTLLFASKLVGVGVAALDKFSGLKKGEMFVREGVEHRLKLAMGGVPISLVKSG